jgi:hypothetical protein
VTFFDSSWYCVATGWLPIETRKGVHLWLPFEDNQVASMYIISGISTQSCHTVSSHRNYAHLIVKLHIFYVKKFVNLQGGVL